VLLLRMGGQEKASLGENPPALRGVEQKKTQSLLGPRSLEPTDLARGSQLHFGRDEKNFFLGVESSGKVCCNLEILVY